MTAHYTSTGSCPQSWLTMLGLSANFDDTASNAVSSRLSGLFQLGNFFIFPLMTNTVFERLTGPEPLLDGFSRFIYVLLNVGGETGASNLGRQQNIKSVRPELLRNQMFRPFCILSGYRIEELRNQTGVQESARRWFTRR